MYYNTIELLYVFAWNDPNVLSLSKSVAFNNLEADMYNELLTNYPKLLRKTEAFKK